MFQTPEAEALIMAAMAGLSTLVGAAAVFITNKKNEWLIAIALGFAAGVMISICFTDLFPKATDLLSQERGIVAGLGLGVGALAVGLLIAAGMERMAAGFEYRGTNGDPAKKELYKVGVVSALAFAIHNLPEGMAMFIVGYEDAVMGLMLAVAVSLHNIPQGISIALPIFLSTGSRKKAFLYTFISGMAEPAGAVLALLILRPILNETVLGFLFGVVAGIMSYVAIEDLIPSSRKYGYGRAGITATIIGICVMPLTHIII